MIRHGVSLLHAGAHARMPLPLITSTVMRRNVLALALACVSSSTLALAQTPASRTDYPPFQTVYDVNLLHDLPASANVFSILEAAQQQISSDRFYTGGLSTGQPARLGAQLASPAQNLFRIGDVNITDPEGSGAPMLFPELQYWQRVSVFTGAMPVDITAPALGISLEPRRPGDLSAGASAKADKWSGHIEGFGSPGWVASTPSSGPPTISRLDSWGHANAVVSGRANGLGVTLGSGWTRGKEFLRAQTNAVEGTVGSGFGHLVFAPSQRDELRVLGWVQRAEYPSSEKLSTRSATDNGVHAQSTWERRVAEGLSWRVFGGLTRRARELGTSSSSPLVVDRLFEGPVPDYASWGGSTQSRVQGGARVLPAVRTMGARRHALQISVDVERTAGTFASPFSGWIGELMDGNRARAWLFTTPSAESHRSTMTVGGGVHDDIELSSSLRAAVGVRYEAVKGSARGAATDISWQSVLPRASFWWHVTDKADTNIYSSYARTGDRLLFNALAVGDPAAPSADVYRWDNAGAQPFGLLAVTPGPLVARMGPGTGGDAAFSRIAPDLARPITDEWTIGIASRFTSFFTWQMTGTARWEHDVLALSNTGVGLEGYTTFTVPNPGGAVTGPSAGATAPIPVYDRLASTFGRDRYELTNTTLKTARHYGVDILFRVDTSRLQATVAGTAQLGNVNAGYRGFLATENDQGVPGDVLSDPNSTTFAYGRPFLDRGFTGKATLFYQLPMDIRVGAIARYQDGQAFAGLLLFPQLRQGADVVRAFENGGTRFTYVGTLDVRLQKGFNVGNRQIDLILDGYNLSHLQNEVEEYPVINTRFRAVTAVQPPLAVHVGARFSF